MPPAAGRGCTMSIEAEYFRRLVEKTRRGDAALLTRVSLQINDGDSLGLLRTLAWRWPLDRFDEISVAVAAPFCLPLRRALNPIHPRFGRWAGGAALLPTCHWKLRRWLLGLVGRDVGGLMLARDEIGWFEFWGHRQ